MKKLLAILTLAVMLFAVGCAAAPAEPVNIAALKGPTGMGISYMMEDTAKYNVELQDAPDVVVGKFASGVFITVMPLDFAYSWSIVSSPAPPRTITFRFGQTSISAWRTLVRERTTMPS